MPPRGGRSHRPISPPAPSVSSSPLRPPSIYLSLSFMIAPYSRCGLCKRTLSPLDELYQLPPRCEQVEGTRWRVALRHQGAAGIPTSPVLPTTVNLIGLSITWLAIRDCNARSNGDSTRISPVVSTQFSSHRSFYRVGSVRVWFSSNLFFFIL